MFAEKIFLDFFGRNFFLRIVEKNKKKIAKTQSLQKFSPHSKSSGQLISVLLPTRADCEGINKKSHRPVEAKLSLLYHQVEVCDNFIPVFFVLI